MYKIQINFNKLQERWLKKKTVETGHSIGTLIRIALNEYIVKEK